MASIPPVESAGAEGGAGGGGSGAASSSDDVCKWLADILAACPTDWGRPDVLDRLADAYDDIEQRAKLKPVLSQYSVYRESIKAIREHAIRRRGKVLQLVSGDVEEGDEERVASIFPDAPVHPLATVPGGWRMSCAGVFRVVKASEEGVKTSSTVRVSPRPIVLTSWGKNLTTGRKMLGVAWRAGTKWHERTVDRELTKETNRLIEALTPWGFTVDSTTARHVIPYLSDYEARNVDESMPIKVVSEQMGWQAGGSFLVGDQSIGKSKIEFHGADSGDEFMASLFAQAGTLDGWRQAVAIASEFPKVELAIYASLAPVLLEPLRAASFCIDWSGGTSIGKTTTLAFAASVWGNPDPRASDTLISSWDTTDVGAERKAAIMSGLPLLIDETKRARTKQGRSIVPEVVYAITNGQGRMRGSKRGLQVNAHWRTILLTNGETSIIDMSKDAGLVARVITLWGSPFNGNADVVSHLVRELSANYGHAGRRFVEWVVENAPAQQVDWQKRFRELHDIFTARLVADKGMVAGRIGEYLAVLELCAELAHEVLELPWDYRSPMSLLCDEIAGHSRTVDRPKEALQLVYQECLSREHQFVGRPSNNAYRDVEVLGVWETEAVTGKWVDLGVKRSFVDEVLTRGGHDIGPMLKAWRDRGWIRTDGANLCPKFTIGVEHPRLVAIRQWAIVDD